MTDYLLILVAYLLGSLSSAIIVCKLMGLPDPRTLGSNNPGATNVLRIGGKKAAAITLLGDMLKGVLPVLTANLIGVPPLILAGVATTIGCQFGIAWQIGGSVALIWLFMAKVIKISSLSALVSMALAPLVVWWFRPDPELVVMQIIMSVILFWRHRSNIQNILSGSEDSIGDDSDSKAHPDS
ncbi:MAG: glycerol-3-phosphate acyltransferase [Gammaproteobacteria bacterium]